MEEEKYFDDFYSFEEYMKSNNIKSCIIDNIHLCGSKVYIKTDCGTIMENSDSSQILKYMIKPVYGSKIINGDKNLYLNFNFFTKIPSAEDLHCTKDISLT